LKKSTKIILWSLLICLLLGAAGYGGWTWYDNNVDRSGWREKDGVTMYADFHGKPITGWLELEGSRYYFDGDFSLHTGWLREDGNTYYADPDGKLHTAWLELPEGTYYLGSDGILVTGWQDIDSLRYYFDGEGRMHTGWLTLDTATHYLREDGSLHTGWLEWENARYYLDESGSPVTGWQLLEEKNYCFDENGRMLTGWLETGDSTFYLDEDGVMVTGWQELDGLSRYFCADGTLGSGWQEADGTRFYLHEDGTRYTGWLQDGEYRYYFHPDGSPATGPVEIDGATEYFTPKGIWVLLVNPWNPLRSDYDPELIQTEDGHWVSARCAEALQQMMDDCEAAGLHPGFSSTYRNTAEQALIWRNYVQRYMDQGYDEGQANAMTAMYVAVPGTSEHHTGLAMDIVGYDYLYGSYPGSTMAVQAWLAEHCWEYGFILRYTADKTAITGFAPETWHFRYVGTEVSMDMKDSGLCLEEYLGAVHD